MRCYLMRVWRESIAPIYFFFNDTATTEIYTLSLHDALPISPGRPGPARRRQRRQAGTKGSSGTPWARGQYGRSEEHTSELQSRQYLVCRLLLEKKKLRRSNCILISDPNQKSPNSSAT